MPINYQNGKIYQIVCNETNEIYIGSTCQCTLAQRLSVHVKDYKKYKKGKSNFVSSYSIIEKGNYNIYLIEDFPCDRNEQLIKREGEIIRKMKIDELVLRKVMNRIIPGRTRAEHYQDNKKRLLEANLEYKNKNKEKIYALQKTKCTCECGATVIRNCITRHKTSQKHIKFLSEKSS